MSQQPPGELAQGNSAEARIILNLLESVERDGAQSQRHLAGELGIALGLVNAYIKRCIKKGLLKVAHAPAGRYAYYLTPSGFSEKSRLTVEFLSYSFSFFRQAKSDCIRVFESARAQGHVRLLLLGHSDLAEIAVICSHECSVEIVTVVDPDATVSYVVRVPRVASFDDVKAEFDAVVVTNLLDPQGAVEKAIEQFGVGRVIVPNLLRLQINGRQEVAS